MFLYSAVVYPVRWTAQSALHVSSPGRPVHSDTNSAYLGSILDMQQLLNDYSLTFPPLSIPINSFIQLSGPGRQWRERKRPIIEKVGKGIRTRTLSIASPTFSLRATALHSRRTRASCSEAIAVTLLNSSPQRCTTLTFSRNNECHECNNCVFL